MWQFAKLSILFALVICSETSPKRYHESNWLKVADAENAERLSGDVVPTSYKIELTVLEENLKNGDFTGTVTISLKATIDSLKSFNIHAKKLTITKAMIDTEDATFGEIDTKNDFLTITPKTPLTKNKEVTLTITYGGKLSDTDMEGFYRSSYKEKDSKEAVYLATTQFEQIGARRAFPCFDEPAIKATFTVIINHPNDYNAISNTEVDTSVDSKDKTFKITTFKETPLMSTYLVAFVVSKFECTTGEVEVAPDEKKNNVTTEVCTRPSGDKKKDEALRKFALDIAPKALEVMTTFTSLYYGDSMKKMTQIAIPDFNVGAMENWGLVTYREADLIIDDAEASNYQKQKVLTVIAHEFAHEWFGDYITLDWWSDAFLNEGFATYFEYHAAHLISGFEKWELPKQFIIEQIQPVLATDSTGNTGALSSDPASDLKDKFDDISYNKGGSILRMVENFLTTDNFKLGLGNYLETQPIGYPDALWNAFDSALGSSPKKVTLPKDTTVETIMDNWTKKPGYPVLEVTAADSIITITQKRLLPSDAKEDKTQWYVPITYSTSKDKDFSKTETQEWLLPDGNVTINITDAEWIVLNNQQVGFYRVNYDDTLLEKITKVLTTKISEIDEISRTQLVDDQLNLARLGQKKYGDVLKFLTFLENEDSYYPWYAAFNGFSYILKRTTKDGQRNAVKAYIQKLLDKTLLPAVPLEKTNDDDQIYTLKQVLAQTWACNLDEESCVNYAKDLFNNDTISVPPNMRSFVYCTGLRTSDDQTKSYNSLWGKYQSTDLATEKVTILKALGCTTDSTLRQTYLNEALGDEVRLQDVNFVFQSVYMNDGVGDVIDFIQNKSADFEGHFGTKSTLNNLISTIADYITTQGEVDKLVAFGKTDKLDDDIKAAVDAATTTAKTNLETIKTFEATLKEYFNSGNNAAVGINGYHFISLAVASVVYFIFNLY